MWTFELHVAKCGRDVVLAAEEAMKPPAVTKETQYTCDHCKGELALRRTKHYRYNVGAFFAHKAKTSTCSGGSKESVIHLKAKYYLKQYVGCYEFCLRSCAVCGPLFGFVSRTTDQVDLEASTSIDGRRFVYDTVISRRGKRRVAVEVFHSHATGQEKIDLTRKAGIEVVEVRAQTVVDMLPELKHARQSGTRVEIPNVVKAHTDMCSGCLQLAQSMAVYEESRYDACAEWTAVVWKATRQYYWLYTTHYYKHYAEWERYLCHRNHNALKRKAYRLAEERARDLSNLKRARYDYACGHVKCCLCARWLPHDKICRVPREKWTSKEYDKVQSWFTFRNQRLPWHAGCCEDCVLPCPDCGDLYPLQNALRYGLCLECNLFHRQTYT